MASLVHINGLAHRLKGQGAASLHEEVLTDGSRVYSVFLDNNEEGQNGLRLACEDLTHANNLFNAITLNCMDIS